MQQISSVQEVTTEGGLLLVLAVLLPFVAALFGFVAGGNHVRRIALAALIIGCGIAISITQTLVESGDTLVYLLGGWLPPLGIALRADGLSVLMLLAISVVIAGIGIYAHADFGPVAKGEESRRPFLFWLLLLAVWGSLNLLFVGGDVFTLYVGLELLTFAAVPLVSLDGKQETLRAALRYLLFALFGSVLYLLGAVLLFGACGTLDMVLLAERIQAAPIAWTAVALMTSGLLAKTALFPLHLWLPPAHAGAPAAASALLSGLVVKGSWFLVLRLWLDVFASVLTLPTSQILAALGAGAIFVGNIVALRQSRLKLLIAYSTVAQIGYLFLMFPLTAGLIAEGLDSDIAVNGGLLQAISHATAKAAMFMAAGLIYTSLGHDRVDELRGVAKTLPMTVLAFALAGASLIGLPPSGGFLAKWWLISAAVLTAQWWWALVMLSGGLLTSIYVFIVVVNALAPAPENWIPKAIIPKYQQAAVLALALCAFLLGAVAFCPLDVAQIGGVR